MYLVTARLSVKLLYRIFPQILLQSSVVTPLRLNRVTTNMLSPIIMKYCQFFTIYQITILLMGLTVTVTVISIEPASLRALTT